MLWCGGCDTSGKGRCVVILYLCVTVDTALAALFKFFSWGQPHAVLAVKFGAIGGGAFFDEFTIAYTTWTVIVPCLWETFGQWSDRAFTVVTSEYGVIVDPHPRTAGQTVDGSSERERGREREREREVKNSEPLPRTERKEM